MPAISLNILEPASDTGYFGSPAVTLRGAVIEPPKELENVILYYRWYSSINIEARLDHYAINETALTDPGTPFSTLLGVGSHIITFAVSDRPGQTAAEMEAMRHGGVTGGFAGDARCVIHVFKAKIIAPVENSILHKNNETLIAEAPLIWGRVKPGTDPVQFEMNAEYDKVDRLKYRWEFVPIGLSDGRQTVNFVPAKNEYIFEEYVLDQNSKLMVIRYTGPLPDNLNGDYQMILHVEDRENKLGGHQATITNCTVI